jgi:hypothetical protein
VNECWACGEDFGSVKAFDAHRVGKHAYLYAEGLKMSPPMEDGRRCLSTQEMEERRWGKNVHGRWTRPEDALRGIELKQGRRSIEQRHSE